MKPEVRKLIISNLPYLLFVYLFGKLGQAFRLAAGADFSQKLLHYLDGFSAAFESAAPSLHPFDLAIGVAGAVLLRLLVYVKGKNAKKYRHGMEYGSARWGGPRDIAPYTDPNFDNNILLTQTERLTMNNRPKDPKTARNKNVLVIGGSGSGKTRFFVKPNLMQCVSRDYPTSFVITDPKGSLIGEVGQLLVRCGYRVKVLNTINFSRSMRYNPFRYIHSEKDILKLVNTLICNTKGEGEKSAEDFWVKSERLLYSALIGYIWYEAPSEEMNFTTLLEMINASEAREDDPEFQSPVDQMFERLEQKDPEHFAVRQYRKFLLSAGKTRSSILISCGARLASFDIREVRERATDELPQSAAGKTIMTTEPKFIPEEAVKISVDQAASFQVRLIDCVGYIVPSALGYIENEQPRMVMTPWFDRETPFNMAAEIGTKKVINEHSTIGLVVTTDGSISDIPRGEYEEAEERVIGELNDIGKPFVVLLNCTQPKSPHSRELRQAMEEKYQVPVVAVNCLELDEDDIREILTRVLYQFPVKEVALEIPAWIMNLPKDHWLQKSIYAQARTCGGQLDRIAGAADAVARMKECENIDDVRIGSIDLGTGSLRCRVDIPGGLFYRILGEATGLEIDGEEGLMPCMVELADIKRKYDKISGALEEVAATGYGIVMPGLDELTLEEPEIVKQGGRYGVRLRASAPSIHMMQANITTEVAPIVGSERQSEELVHYLLKEFEEDLAKIWESNIFGKSLHELVNEGLHNKLYRMPSDARMKMQETTERIINEGCSGLICIIL